MANEQDSGPTTDTPTIRGLMRACLYFRCGLLFLPVEERELQLAWLESTGLGDVEGISGVLGCPFIAEFCNAEDIAEYVDEDEG